MLEVVGSPVDQAAGETKVYDVTTTVWGSTPSAVVVTAEDITDTDNITDKTADILSGSAPAPSGDIITLMPVTALTAGQIYRIIVEFVSGNDTNQCFLIINGKR